LFEQILIRQGYQVGSAGDGNQDLQLLASEKSPLRVPSLSGADATLTKPVGGEELAAAVSPVLAT
jgi:hypothetical protein